MFFFSQCCYQILECWVTPESIARSVEHVWELLASFEVVCQGNSYDRRRKQLVQKLEGYFRSESYLRLENSRQYDFNPKKVIILA